MAWEHSWFFCIQQQQHKHWMALLYPPLGKEDVHVSSIRYGIDLFTTFPVTLPCSYGDLYMKTISLVALSPGPLPSANVRVCSTITGD